MELKKYQKNVMSNLSSYLDCLGRTENLISAWREYIMCTLMRKDSTSASNCIECGKCEQHCQQHIPIPQELKNARKELEGFVYKVAKKVIPIFFKY